MESNWNKTMKMIDRLMMRDVEKRNERTLTHYYSLYIHVTHTCQYTKKSIIRWTINHIYIEKDDFVYIPIS
jgi:hypothetical protein